MERERRLVRRGMVPWVAKIRAQQQMLHVCGVVVVAPRRAVDGLTAVQMCHAALTDGLLSYYHCWFEQGRRRRRRRRRRRELVVEEARYLRDDRQEISAISKTSNVVPRWH